MRRLGVACFAVSLSAAVHGQDTLPSVEQHGSGSQNAENLIDVGTLESLTDAYMAQMLDFGATGSLSQTGANAVNTVSYSGDLENVVQRFNGTQSVANRLALGAVNVHGVVDQSGKNVANSTKSRQLDFADQLLGADGSQLVLNSAEIALLYGEVSQTGVNLANHAEAELAIGSATQNIALGAVQRVDNRLAAAAMSAVSAAITQKGENFGNILISDTVDSVTRNFAGDQVVHNVVQLGEGAAGPITQHGANVANFIQSSRIGSLEQTSIGSQQVINEVLGPGTGRMGGSDVVQTSEDSVNVILLTAPADGRDEAVIEVAQTADFPQSSNSSGGGSQSGNSLVVNR